MVKRENEVDIDIDIDNTHPALTPRCSEKHPEMQRGNKTGVERTNLDASAMNGMESLS